MAAALATRKGYVRTLRGLARTCGVELVRDDARKDKVEALAAALAGEPTLDAEGKRSAATALAAFLSTFEPEQPAQAAEVAEEAGKFRLRGKSLLLTYNWDFLNKTFKDGTPCPETPEQLWRVWLVWKREKKAELGVAQSTSTLEASLHSPSPDRVHFHWKVNLREPVDLSSTAVFAFHGVMPDARPTVVYAALSKQGRGANAAEASNRAHFYAWAPKTGTLYRGTNWAPWKKYRVLGKWLDDLWTDGKLDHDNFNALALKVRLGYSNRKRELELLRASEKEARVDQQLTKASTQLNKLKAPSRVFPEVLAWEDSFLHLNFRWKLLVLVADSASGKSTFAEGLFDNPYLLTVEDATDLDLKAFDRESHDGLVLDNVNSWQQLLSWRAILQARNAKSRGGQSATNVYSYVQYLFGVAVVATIDLDAPDAYLADAQQEGHSKWLLKNCVFVRLPAGATFYNSAALPKLKLDNKFSLFAGTVKRRRTQQGH